MILVGLTGTLGAGKGTVVDYLQQNKNFTHFAVSDDFLNTEALNRGIEPSRIARQDIANEFRSTGPTALMQACYDQAVKEGVPERLILEPQHTKAEIEFIKDKGGIVIAVDADLPVRFERIQKRGSTKDNVSYDEFVRVQNLEMASDDPNKNNLAAAIEAADYYILNNGTLADLHGELDSLCSKLGIK